jgi:hypothetical protein
MSESVSLLRMNRHPDKRPVSRPMVEPRFRVIFAGLRSAEPILRHRQRLYDLHTHSPTTAADRARTDKTQTKRPPEDQSTTPFISCNTFVTSDRLNFFSRAVTDIAEETKLMRGNGVSADLIFSEIVPHRQARGREGFTDPFGPCPECQCRS